jgi:outer membrane protein OmpA-like peptidoglycan-associated protein/tetratricopeptide (TPR) repeat protein
MLKNMHITKLSLGFFIVFLVFNSVSTVAQTGKLVKADKNFDNYNYQVAIDLYLDLVKSGYKATTKEHVTTRLGDSYRLINDPEKAEQWYRIAVESNDCKPITYFYLAQVLRSNKKYNEISIWLNRYLASNPENRAGIKKLAQFNDYDKILADSTGILVRPMDKINTKMAEFSPAFVGDKIIFVSSRDTISARKSAWTDEPFYSLYECEIDSDYNLISYKKLFGEVNTRFHEGPMSYHEKTKTLYFTRNNFIDHKKKTSKDNTNYLKVFQAKYKEGEWTAVKELPFNNNEYSCAHPAISPDGKKLYFISNMPGGYGGTDLYYCEKDDGSWSNPKNLGLPINTAGNELFPTISHNGNLYFASDGHPGLGGLDIFMVVNEEIKNVGYPVNTNYDDFGLTTINDERGFFSSNRHGGINNDDLFYFRINHPPVALNDTLYFEILDNNYDVTQSVRLSDNDTDPNNDIDTTTIKIIQFGNKNATPYLTNGNFSYKPAEGFAGNDVLRYVIFDEGGQSDTANIYVYVYGKNPPVATADSVMLEKNTVNNDIFILENDYDIDDDLSKDSVSIVKAPEHGKIENINDMVLYTPDKDYFGDDYFVYKNYDELGLTDIDTVFIQIYTIFMGQVVTPNFELNLEINFHTARWDITPEAAVLLDSLVDALKAHPTFEIELGAHTDSRGSATSNQKLSQKRAESAVAYIMKKGIATGRITAKGYGESQLTNICADGVKCSKEEHARNRRVTIRLTKF